MTSRFTFVLAFAIISLGDRCKVKKQGDWLWRMVTSDWNSEVMGVKGPGAVLIPQRGSSKPIWHLDTRLVPTREEMAKILAVAKERSARTYVYLAIGSHLGFRLCEIAHLKSSDICDGKVAVTRRKKRYLQETIVEVPDSLWPTLSEWASSYDGYIFPGRAKPCIIRRSKKGVMLEPEQVCNGGHISLRVIQRDFALLVAEAGLRKYGRGFHQTRHYFGTQFYNATRDIRATQEALAHSSIEMTTRYAHVIDMKEKVNKVPGLL